MIAIQKECFDKIAAKVAPFIQRFTGQLFTGNEKKLIKNRVESYLQSKALTPSDNTRQGSRKRV